MTNESPREGSLTTGTLPMPMCPMADACKRMMDNLPSRFLMFLPGIVFIVIGVLVAVEPSILVWLIAAVSIFIGFAMLGGAYFMRTVGSRLTRPHHCAQP